LHHCGVFIFKSQYVLEEFEFQLPIHAASYPRKTDSLTLLWYNRFM